MLWLPEERDTAQQALAEDRVEPRTARDLGTVELPVATDLAAPEMAVRAGAEALRRSGLPAERLSALFHAWMHYQGHDLWSPAHYVADQLGAHEAVPVGIRQICNGGAAALELAVAHLSVAPGSRSALVLTADRFTHPGFDRWRSDFGAAYGDGATALVVQQPAGPQHPLLLRSMSTVVAAHLESMHRGSDPFAQLPYTNAPMVDMRRTKREYFARHGIADFTRVGREMILRVLAGALRDADCEPDDPRIRMVVLPRLGRKVLETSWTPVIREYLPAPCVDWGRATGHLGPGDMAAGMSELLLRSELRPGELAVLLNSGAGFTWSAAVVEATGA